MNFISHYFLDRDKTSSFFFVGVSTPDLISNFDSRIRLKESKLPLIVENDASEMELRFYQGVLRHFDVDKRFHSSQFFRQETRYLSSTLKRTFPDDSVNRGFFVAHILLELILDRVLIRRHNELLFSFYKHFDKTEIDELVALTEWVSQKKLPGYGEFLEKFAEKQFLYRYVDMRYLLRVIRKILNKVGINQHDYIRKPQFLNLMHEYEARLARLYEPAMKEFSYS
ncbi:MAG: hypothetical protein AAF694_16100 [Bacteroidota bacterium]